ncbi:hypothetical protein [Actinomadura gamaensis]|uniref:Secreted protein n=1 Tax=Actinomadura gamaensis TaxID=1763541 RepID=A0ABV9TYW3_9ACTN
MRRQLTVTTAVAAAALALTALPASAHAARAGHHFLCDEVKMSEDHSRIVATGCGPREEGRLRFVVIDQKGSRHDRHQCMIVRAHEGGLRGLGCHRV